MIATFGMEPWAKHANDIDGLTCIESDVVGADRDGTGAVAFAWRKLDGELRSSR